MSPDSNILTSGETCSLYSTVRIKSIELGAFILTINVPVVYMARYVMVLRRARSITSSVVEP